MSSSNLLVLECGDHWVSNLWS